MYISHRDVNTPPDDQIIYRYRNLGRIKQILSSSCLYFSRLDQLQDKYEGRYPGGNLKNTNREALAEQQRQEHKSALEEKDLLAESFYRNAIENTRQKMAENADVEISQIGLDTAEEKFIDQTIDKLAELTKEDPSAWEEKARRRFFVNCWQVSDYESFPMWQSYTNPRNSAVIVSTVGDLKEAVSQHITDHIHIGEVDYMDSQSGQISERGQFHLALQKRMEYRHEDEVRGIISRRPPRGNDDLEHPNGIEARIRLTSLINEIRVSPEASQNIFDEICELCGEHEGLEKNIVDWSTLK